MPNNGSLRAEVYGEGMSIAKNSSQLTLGQIDLQPAAPAVQPARSWKELRADLQTRPWTDLRGEVRARLAEARARIRQHDR